MQTEKINKKNKNNLDKIFKESFNAAKNIKESQLIMNKLALGCTTVLSYEYTTRNIINNPVPQIIQKIKLYQRADDVYVLAIYEYDTDNENAFNQIKEFTVGLFKNAPKIQSPEKMLFPLKKFLLKKAYFTKSWNS